MSKGVATKPTELPERYTPGFLQGMDRRTDIYKCLKGALEEIIDDNGGLSVLPRTLVSLIERFVFLEAMVQSLEVRIAMNPKNTEHLVGKWIQAVNSLQGLASRIGLERVQRPGITLKAYLDTEAV